MPLVYRMLQNVNMFLFENIKNYQMYIILFCFVANRRKLSSLHNVNMFAENTKTLSHLRIMFLKTARPGSLYLEKDKYIH